MFSKQAFNKQTKWFIGLNKQPNQTCAFVGAMYLALSFLFCDKRGLQEPLEEPLLSATHTVCLSVGLTDILSARQTGSVEKW